MTFLSYNQRFNRSNGIILLRAKINERLNEFQSFSQYQKELFSYYCSIQENLTYINMLKNLLYKIKSPYIINLKRKFIDLTTFWIIKKNKNNFDLKEDYCPKQNYLDKILKILKEKHFGKKIQNDVNEKIKYIEDLLNKNISITSYPLKIKNSTLYDIFDYFTYYKNHFNDIVHIGKQGIKYYMLPNEENIKVEIGESQIFNEFMKEKDDNKKNVDVNQIDEDFSENGGNIEEVDVKFVFELLFKSIENHKKIDGKLTQNLKLIKKEKNALIDSELDFMTGCFKELSKLLKDNSCIPNFESSEAHLTPEMVSFIEKACEEFDTKINRIDGLIIGLKLKGNNIEDRQKLINQIIEDIVSLGRKEISLKDEYFIWINENHIGKLVLAYFQYKYMKLRKLYNVINQIYDNFKADIEKQKSIIRSMLSQLVDKSYKLCIRTKNNFSLQTGKEIFGKWKKKRNKLYYNFDIFYNNIVELLKEVKVFKIDDEIIIDQINSCWLVKNELDKYVLA